MSEPTWEELPESLRRQIDELVLEDQLFRAVRELRDSRSEPQIGLNHCMVLVDARYMHFGDRIRRAPEPPRDPATLIEKVEALSARPDAIEALWDGDTRGWTAYLYAVTREPRTEVCLAAIGHRSARQEFDGTVPPCPQGAVAVETGTAVARHFAVPFFFLHPEKPDIEDQRWWDTV
jgi:hypothetical protein